MRTRRAHGRNEWHRSLRATMVLASLTFGATGFALIAPSTPSGASTPTTPLGLYVYNDSTGPELTFALPSTGNVAPASSLGYAEDSYNQAFDASGDLWLPLYEGESVVEFTPTQLAAGGTLSPTLTVSNAALGHPAALAFSPTGSLWVANFNGSTLVEFSAASLAAGGTQTPEATISAVGNDLDEPSGIAFDATGDLWVTARDGAMISEFTPAQQATAGTGLTPTVELTGLTTPNALTFDDHGDLWFSDQGGELSELTPSQLAPSSSPSSPTPAVLLNENTSILDGPDQLAFDHNGNLWAGSFSSGGPIDGFSPAQLTASGSPTPTDEIQGAKTELAQAAGLALADPPAAPANVTATATGASIQLSWSRPNGPMYPTDYIVTPYLNGVAQSPIDMHSASTSFTMTGVADAQYVFDVSAVDVFGGGPSGVSNAAETSQGYIEVASDGGVFAFGSAASLGSMGGKPLNAPIVGAAEDPTGPGYWLVAADGGIFGFGDSIFQGSVPGVLKPGQTLNKPIVGMASTPDGGGYWLVASDGGVFAFGDATSYGSVPGILKPGQALNKPIVGIAATPDGKGYWVVASDGGIFSFGDANSQGSVPGILKPGQVLNQPIVGMAATADGGGYWVVAADGGIFSFGDATSYGSVPGILKPGQTLNKPIVGMAVTSDGGGYWVAAADGGVFSFGDATSQGSVPGILKPGQVLDKPIVGMAS